MTDQIAEYVAVGSGRMTVTADRSVYQFRITGRKHTLTISDDEAVELAQAIMLRSSI